jgi:DNA polymerase I-like protein with 3'-5' exonuclease and polymerase domains
MGMPRLQSEKIHDTLFLLFLDNPHALSLSLKPSAERILGMPPEERDILKEWIIANVPEAKRKPSEWGAYICKAPGKLVGRYADGDVLRTDGIFNKVYPTIVDRGMLGAYTREQQLMPILMDSEREGIRCDLPKLERDYGMYQQALGTADSWLRKQLHSPNLNLDADVDVAEALHRSGVVTEWAMTKTGRRSTSKKNMTLDKFNNSKIAQVWGYRQRLSTCISTFMEPWLNMARESGGIIFTTWNQVRQAHGNDGAIGTRTGRLSSTPNFQNIPRDFEDNNDGWTHPVWFKALPPLPLMRGYLLPDVGCTWIKRDYAQQELRILAHFEAGSLLDKYNTDPEYDMHDDVLQYAHTVAQLDINRSGIKILNFGDIYGMGVGEFMRKARLDERTARMIKRAKRAMMPDFARMDEDIKRRGRAGIPIHTWGGREYYCEEGQYVEKYRRHMTFEYKLLNYLIQGSAADCTKEAVIRYHYHPNRQARFLLTVHDECNASSPAKRWKEEMAVLREVMESIEFDTTMFSDGSHGKNWADLSDMKGEVRVLNAPKPKQQVGYTKELRGEDVEAAYQKIRIKLKQCDQQAANFVLAEQGLKLRGNRVVVH